MIDLHSHTTFSDGELAPESLLALAAEVGVKQLAVTDHDTVGGLSRAVAHGNAVGVTVIPGIEVSAFLGGREVHILGHFVDFELPELKLLSQRLAGQRAERMVLMVTKLQALGIPVTMAEVQKVAQGASLGRPHLARALVNGGHVTSAQEAFNRWLADGRAAHVPAFRISAADAIALLHRARGTATLAHPGVNKMQDPELKQLKEAGLDGIEVFHPEHVPSQRGKLLRQAADLDLLPTAGSDFHGPTVSPGRRLGMESLTPDAFAALEARRPH